MATEKKTSQKEDGMRHLSLQNEDGQHAWRQI